MALTYCEVCGILIKGDRGRSLPEGIICDGCFESRRVAVPEESADEVLEVLQFECVYCRSVLRLKISLGRRVHIRCPKCSETFFMREDGSVEARLEGGTTAILVRDQEGFKPLTPSGGTREEGDRTQKLARRTESGEVVFLDDALQLRPEDDDAPPPATPRVAAEEAQLELLPAELGAAGGYAGPREPGAGEEGQVDLDPDGPRREPARHQRGKETGRSTRREEPTESRELCRAEERRRRRERDRRATQALKKAEALEARKARRVLLTALVWALAVIPGLLSLVLSGMACRGAALTDPRRGGLGRVLVEVGTVVDNGIRSLNELLPEEVRFPGMTEERHERPQSR